MPTEWGKEIVRLAVFFYVETDPAIRIWSGNGWFDMGPNTVDLTGGRYLGAGQLLNVPEVNALINGVAERVEFGLAGAAITSRVVELADEEADTVRGCEAWIGLVGFNDQEIPTSLRWPWNGRCDSTQITYTANGLANPARSVSLSVGSLFTFRQRASLGYWVGPDQRRRSPDDRFCERVASLSVETQKLWPRN